MKGKKSSAVAASGAVALIFLILGFQIAIFSGNVFRFRQEAAEEAQARAGASDGDDSVQADDVGDVPEDKSPMRKALEASASRERDYGDSRTVIAERVARSKAETFEFDPNSVSLEELCRLGFSERQAQVILNYRDKGGHFRSAADFAKMYVVDSAAFARLEPFIRIPKIDLNAADSEALLSLRGIGPYYASKILSYRQRLGGSFSSLDQLLEIDGFSQERLDGFRDDVELRRASSRFNIWEATQAQLEAHPYIGSYAAKGIIRFKRTVDTLSWSLSALVNAGILTAEKAAKL